MTKTMRGKFGPQDEPFLSPELFAQGKLGTWKMSFEGAPRQ
jgi:hypothetical protein